MFATTEGGMFKNMGNPRGISRDGPEGYEKDIFAVVAGNMVMHSLGLTVPVSADLDIQRVNSGAVDQIEC